VEGRFAAVKVVKRYTERTIKIRNSSSMESLACGFCGEALFDQWLIPLGLTIFSDPIGGLRFSVKYSHFLILVRFVLASVAPPKRRIQ
jgi:hypothetical protein